MATATISKNNVLSSYLTKKIESRTSSDHLVDLNTNNINLVIDKLFLKAQGAYNITFDLAGILL